MPPRTLFDIGSLDLSRVIYGPDVIRTINPQRFEMEHLDAIVHCDPPTGQIVGYKDVKADEFWIPGHIPGRPLLPGVIMVESAAQLSSFYTKYVVKVPGFIGFGGIENCKFRMQVQPGQRLYLLGQYKWYRHHRICSEIQGLIDGQIAFDATIIGAELG